MTVTSIKEAWRKADIIFPTDYLLDSERTAKAGYNIYWSTLEGCTAWISDLGNRLEVNLPDGKTVNIWIEGCKFKEYQIADALSAISNTIYEIDDKVNNKLADELGITEARNQMYAAYSKIKTMLDTYYPDSELIAEYNLKEV